MTATAQANVIPIESVSRPVKLRRCHHCGAEDRETGAFNIELAQGQEVERAVHYVQPEIAYVDRASDQAALVRRLTIRGFTPLVFQGRKAMQRMMCMDCMNLQQIADKLHAEYKRSAQLLERKAKSESNFYYALCDMGDE